MERDVEWSTAPDGVLRIAHVCVPPWCGPTCSRFKDQYPPGVVMRPLVVKRPKPIESTIVVSPLIEWPALGEAGTHVTATLRNESTWRRLRGPRD
jgi:hypothetical protein